ncbi:hypothetical protein [Cupriavidus pauculus]|uniref:Uncharacterized protein n=1 Tax=Cupriavidus pauculus TaxID=82633 RepID=A0A3G8H0B1_9BURK|nr:hypothetical protein [Cupriavidus pauculus]AZG13877.1 hypothetical protein EHF44_10690 [Cupriavidus pauculus]
MKFLDEIASEVGYARGSNVSRALRREFPEVAAEINKRSWFPNQKAPKKERFFRYIEEGQHLRDPEGELSAANLKTQYEIADEVGTNQKNTSELLREYFPAIAAVMTNRKRYDQEE